MNGELKLGPLGVASQAAAPASRDVDAALTSANPDEKGWAIATRSDRNDRVVESSVVELKMILSSKAGRGRTRQRAVAVDRGGGDQDRDSVVGRPWVKPAPATRRVPEPSVDGRYA